MLVMYELLPSALRWPGSRPEELPTDDLLALPACPAGTVMQPEETADIKCRREWDLPSYPTTVASAAGLRVFAVGCHDGAIVLYSSSTLALHHICDGHYDAVVSLSFSRVKEAKQCVLCSWSLDGFVHVYSLESGSLIFRSRLVKPADMAPLIEGVCGPTNLPLAVGVDTNGQLRMFDVTAGRKLARLSAPKGWKPIQVFTGRRAAAVLAAAEEGAEGEQPGRHAVLLFDFAAVLAHLYPAAVDLVGPRKADDAEVLYYALSREDKLGTGNRNQIQVDPKSGPPKLTAAALESQRQRLAEEEGDIGESLTGPTGVDVIEWFECTSWASGVHSQMKTIIGDRNARNARISRRIEALLKNQF